MTAPTKEPLSWLLLERYALGELDPDERRRVEVQLAESPADRACLEQIRSDNLALPPLPLTRLPQPKRLRSSSRTFWLGMTSACAAAAAVLLFVQGSNTDVPPATRSVKGGDLAIQLVSANHGPNPRSFDQGERFKVLITCPPGFLGNGASGPRVLMFQGERVYEPLQPVPDFACGNLVPHPGAFALDGREDVTVCVDWERGQAVRSVLDLGSNALCTRLHAR